MAAILGNPRYTGRQVRNRQRTDQDLVDPEGTPGLGHRGGGTVEPAWGLRHLRPPGHSALVSEADFALVAGERQAATDSSDHWNMIDNPQ